MSKSGKRRTTWGRKRNKQRNSSSSKVRPTKVLQFEHLEGREMLSIDPVIATDDPGNKQANLDRMVDLAFQRVSDLNQYTESQLEGATRWVIRSDNSVTAGNLFAETGLLHGSTFSPISNTFFALAGNQTSEQIIASLGSNSSVVHFYPEVPREVETFGLTDDPLVRKQWHIRNTGQKISRPDEVNNFSVWGADMRVEEAWKITHGEGVTVGVIDDGLMGAHPDLAPNYNASLSHDYNDSDPNPASPIDSHGTAVSGIIAAKGNNGTGVTGVAYEAEIAGIRLIGGNDITRGATITDERIYQALTHNNQLIDLYNNSWGSSAGRGITSSGPMQIQGLIDGLFLGRGGLGTIHVNASGNSALQGDNTSHDDFASRLYTIAVSGFSQNDTFASYAEGGSSIFVTAPTGDNPPGTGIFTTDLVGDLGYNSEGIDNDGAGRDFLEDTNYTSNFNGTSAASPAATGVIALMISAARANGIELSYRDIKDILAQSSRRINPTDFGGGDIGGWQANARPVFTDPQDLLGVPYGAMDPTYPGVSAIPTSTDFQFANPTNGAGFYVHDGFDYGYGHGAVDARLAVELARNYQNLDALGNPHTQHQTTVISAGLGGPTPIPAMEMVGTIPIPGGIDGTPGFQAYYEMWINQPVPLPDPLPPNTRGSSSIPLVVPANYSIEEVEITLDITIAAAASDKLRMTLISPDGVHSEVTNWIKTGAIGPLANDGNINHTFTTVRHWGERTEGVGRTDPITGDRIAPAVVTGANDEVTAGVWQLVIENWSTSPATLNGGSVDFHATKTPVLNDLVGNELSGRIQGSIGIDINQDGVVNATGIIADTLDIDSTVNGIPATETIIVLDAAAPPTDPILDPNYEPMASEVIVWVDLNKDGIRDADEPYKTTGADGNFYFDLPWNDDATPGNVGFDYDVRFELPAGHTNPGPDVQTFRLGVQDDGDAGTDDPIIATHHTANFVLTPEAVTFEGNVFSDFNANRTQDFGDSTLEEFRVFVDINENGILDYSDVNGNLRFDNGIDIPLEPMQITGADGSFSIEVSTDVNLVQDFFGNDAFLNERYKGKKSYTLMVDARAGWAPTGIDVSEQGYNSPLHAGQQSPGLGFHRIFVKPGQTKVDMKFSVAPDFSSISGVVYNDLNQNGTRTANEGGLAGFTVFLDLDQSGDLSAGDLTVITGANGNYLFEDLPAGTYDIRVVLGPGYIPSDQTSPLGDFYDNRLLAEGATLGGGLVDFGFFDPDSTSPAARDFGDLGAPYKTLIADGGPSHGIASTYYLGAGVTSEANGQPSAAATLDGSDDGVVFVDPIVAGTFMQINVTAGSNLLFLQGWVDFNDDGDFDDEGEHLAFLDSSGSPLPYSQQHRLEIGLNELYVVVPDAVTAATVAARFRYSEGGPALFNEPNAPAILGEVEDYVLPATISTSFIELLQGDYNGDNTVDANDYLVWKQTFGSTVDFRADGNADGKVDAADFTIWRNNLGATATANLQIAPAITAAVMEEPAPLETAAVMEEPASLSFVTMVDGQLAPYEPTTAPVRSSYSPEVRVAPEVADYLFDQAFAEEQENDTIETLLTQNEGDSDTEALDVALEDDLLIVL